MKNGSDYLQRTESAVQTLFQGIDGYLALIRAHQGLVFVGGGTDRTTFDRDFEAWKTENSAARAEQRANVQKFMDESFALATLCGAVLQIAAKGIELHSKNTNVPAAWRDLIKQGSKPALYCRGREVRGVPLGLIVLAGRSQHAHYDDKALREPNVTIFNTLALGHGYTGALGIKEPGLDLTNDDIQSFATNITFLVNWRSYATYEEDMRQLVD